MPILVQIKEMNINTIGFLGSDGGKCLTFCDQAFLVPSSKTARIQEVHITAGHAVIEYIETRLLQEGFLSIS